PLPTRPPLFPYTTLFRSRYERDQGGFPAASSSELCRSVGSRSVRVADAHAGGEPSRPAGPVRRSREPLPGRARRGGAIGAHGHADRKSTRLNSSHVSISY